MVRYRHLLLPAALAALLVPMAHMPAFAQSPEDAPKLIDQAGSQLLSKQLDEADATIKKLTAMRGDLSPELQEKVDALRLALHDAHEYPEPAANSKSWELDYESHPPERLIVTNGKGETQVYWYVRYKVTNNTSQDQLFTPEFQLITDTGQVIDSGKGVPTAIFDQIKKLYHADLMDSPIEVLGRLKQGPDNARESVAIFTGVDKDARKFRIITTGIYGEVAEMKSPLPDKPPTIVRKALVLDYDMPGEALGIPPSPVLKEKSFVMK